MSKPSLTQANYPAVYGGPHKPSRRTVALGIDQTPRKRNRPKAQRANWLRCWLASQA